jgi:peptide chain release factor subunit 1
MSQTYDLRDQIEHLESLTGDGTELVTVTVPKDKSLGSIRERIAQEYASAENIKSDQTQDHVQQALKRVQRILRRYQRTPETGLGRHPV